MRLDTVSIYIACGSSRRYYAYKESDYIELFDSEIITPQVEDIEIFADEIKPFRNKRDEIWLYIAMLFIPLRRKDILLQSLLEARRESLCDSEIKCHDLDKTNKRWLAERWVNIVLRNKNEKSIYFNIIGIKLSNLYLPRFGHDQFRNIYNRFFRSCILSGIISCFRKLYVNVRNVYHDNGDISSHKYFPWHSIYSIEDRNYKITFNRNKISFINSDHRRQDGNENSNFIQLIDLLMGLISHCLDFTSTNRYRTKLAQLILPLLERMLINPLNTNSRYGHTNKYLISFFPKKRLSGKQLEDPYQRQLSGFYKARPILLKEHLSQQQSLFEQL